MTLIETAAVSGNYVSPMIEIIAATAMAFFFLIMLVAIDPYTTVIIVAGLILLYSGTYFALRNRLSQVSEQQLDFVAKRFLHVAEVLGGVKEIKLRGLERETAQALGSLARRLAYISSWGGFLSQTPRTLVEGLVIFVAVGVLALYASAGGNTESPFCHFRALWFEGTGFCHRYNAPCTPCLRCALARRRSHVSWSSSIRARHFPRQRR